MKRMYTTLMFLLYLFTASAQFTWLTKNAFPGTGRLMTGYFTINSSAYMIGGYTIYPNTMTSEVWEFNATTGTWTQKSNFPTNITLPGCFSIGGKGYIVGGAATVDVYGNPTYEYDPVADTWTPKASYPLATFGEGFSFVINGLAYVGGGVGSNSVYAYDPVADTWTSKAAFPGPHTLDAVYFSIDSFGYVGLGGPGSLNPYNQFYKYDPSANSWSQIANFPGTSRSSAMSFVINGKAYVGGGWSSIQGQCLYDVSDFYEFDPSTEVWTAVPGFPGPPRQFATPFSLNNLGYIVGGYNDVSDTSMTNVNEFGPCDLLASAIPPSPTNNKVKVQIFPNPTTGDINVKINNSNASLIQYNVLSIDGKALKSGTSSQNQFTLTTGKLSNGVYLLQIKDNENNYGIERFEVVR